MAETAGPKTDKELVIAMSVAALLCSLLFNCSKKGDVTPGNVVGMGFAFFFIGAIAATANTGSAERSLGAACIAMLILMLFIALYMLQYQ